MLSKTIYQTIREEYDSGKKQIEIARKFNVDQQIISRILSGDRSVSGMRLETIEKMFPNATIHLNGDKVNIKDNHGTAYGIIHGDVKNIGSESGIPKDVLNAIMDNKNLSPSEKAQMVKELMRQ
ncbi:MAG: helix-turn-helix transcriptional regulator [Lentisphaeria bacterium]|nr:helix-turn-helix transcriptional regulator [Lentisphaeria bacterium]